MDISQVRFLQIFLKPIRRGWKYLSRLYVERKAGRGISKIGSSLIDIELDRTLARLRGEEVEDTFLSQIQTFLAHRIITPQFLREAEIKNWLSDHQIRTDLKALASARLMGSSADVNEAVERLREAHLKISKKEIPFADEAIEVVVDILLAGYKASIHSDTVPLSGMVQAGAKANKEGFEKTGKVLISISDKLNSFGPDDLIVNAFSEQVTKELDRIIKRRGILVDRAREEIRVLAQQVLGGKYHYANKAIKTKVLYWASRLHAADSKHISLVENYLEELHKLNPDYDIRIINALIAEQKGNIDVALQFLRDIDNSDGHSTIWAILNRTRGKQAAVSWFEEQPGHIDPEFFTGIGWSNLAVSLAEMGLWEKAADYLAAAQGHLEDWPDLAFVEGVINAAMLLPVEIRHLALRMNIFHSHIKPVIGPNIAPRRTRAYECFNRAAKLIAEIGEEDRAEVAKVWLLWLKLTEEKKEISETASREVAEAMKDPAQAVDFLPVALAFDVDFDKGPLQRYLMQRKQMGGLKGQEIIAEVLLSEITMTAREYADFLEQEEGRLVTGVPIATLAGKRIEALLADGQIARAKHVLEEHREDFFDDYDRLRVMILKREGEDARTTLEEIYTRTGDLLDLQNLVQGIYQAGDWTSLRPLAEKLFKLERTKFNAWRLVECMQRDPKSGCASIVWFFKENPDVADWSDDFKSAKAWAFFYMGQVMEARIINDQLLNVRTDQTDLQLDMNIAIQLGDWERFPTIVDREWSKRDQYSADLLLRLASLAAEADTTASRAIELSKLAASKGPNDPNVLMNASSLVIQLGRDHDADPTWMSRAADLSSSNGPVHRVDMRTLVQELMPAHRERQRLIERNLLQGEVPLHMAAELLHMPLSRMLIDLPRRNAEQNDGRQRVILPIASGARQIITLQQSWVVGLDITSLMVLGYLDLLRNILNAFNGIVLAPETMVFLLNERRRVRFHQPSRIENAEEIRELIEKGQLKPVTLSIEPPPWLVEEVGRDLADMLEAARINNGHVVHPRPIYQLRTFLEREAVLKEYDDLILSTTDLGRLLVETGKLSGEKYIQARKYLAAHDKGQKVDTLIAASIFSAPIYLDDLAITYLQQAGLLQSVCRCGVDLWVLPSMREEQSTLMSANREGERLNNRIDDIRSVLCEALNNGKAVFLPRHDVDNEMIGSLSGFLADTGSCDVVCIDDRYLNRHSLLTDKKGRNVPITCTLDLISYLEAHGLIDNTKKQASLHRLREGGFAFVPIDPDELERLLRAALFDQNHQLIESPELRVIRQLLMRICSLHMSQQPAESPYLVRLRLACILTIRRLWQDDFVAVNQAVTLTNWVWKNVLPSPIDWERTTHLNEGGIQIREAYVGHLALLFSPMGDLKPMRYEAYLQWVEHAVLEPLLPGNHSLIDDLAKQIKIEIKQLIEKMTNGN